MNGLLSILKFLNILQKCVTPSLLHYDRVRIFKSLLYTLNSHNIFTYLVFCNKTKSSPSSAAKFTKPITIHNHLPQPPYYFHEYFLILCFRQQLSLLGLSYIVFSVPFCSHRQRGLALVSFNLYCWLVRRLWVSQI
jgi:hypothetical protein